MNASQISASTKTSLDRSLLQSLQPQVRPEKEFSDIFSTTQAPESRRASADRRDQQDPPETASRDQPPRTKDKQQAEPDKDINRDRENVVVEGRDDSPEQDGLVAGEDTKLPPLADKNTRSDTAAKSNAVDVEGAEVADINADLAEGSPAGDEAAELIDADVDLITAEGEMLPACCDGFG